MKLTFKIYALSLALIFPTQAAPVTFEEISLFVRMNETNTFITQEVIKRRLLYPITPQQEVILQEQGAQRNLIKWLRDPNLHLAESDAIAFVNMQEQQRVRIYEEKVYNFLRLAAFKEQQEKINREALEAAKAAPAPEVNADQYTNAELATANFEPLSQQSSYVAPYRARPTFISASRTQTPNTSDSITETGPSSGPIQFRNIYNSNGNSINGSTTRIGDFDFHNYTTSNGSHISGSTNHIGNFGFHNLSSSDGIRISGTTNQIGEFGFNNFTTSNGNRINGTSVRIGNMIFHNSHDSNGHSTSGTTMDIGGTTFSNFNDW